MTKTASVVIAVLLACALGACGSSHPAAAPAGPSTADQQSHACTVRASEAETKAWDAFRADSAAAGAGGPSTATTADIVAENLAIDAYNACPGVRYPDAHVPLPPT
jgi:hypothetical protein